MAVSLQPIPQRSRRTHRMIPLKKPMIAPESPPRDRADFRDLRAGVLRRLAAGFFLVGRVRLSATNLGFLPPVLLISALPRAFGFGEPYLYPPVKSRPVWSGAPFFPRLFYEHSARFAQIFGEAKDARHKSAAFRFTSRALPFLLHLQTPA